jgi:hypothetical protein
MNHTDAGEIGPHGTENEFVEREPRLLLVQSMQIQPRLDGKTSRPKVIKIEPPAGLNGGFNIFRRVLHLDVAVL